MGQESVAAYITRHLKFNDNDLSKLGEALAIFPSLWNNIDQLYDCPTLPVEVRTAVDFIKS